MWRGFACCGVSGRSPRRVPGGGCCSCACVAWCWVGSHPRVCALAEAAFNGRGGVHEVWRGAGGLWGWWRAWSSCGLRRVGCGASVAAIVGCQVRMGSAAEDSADRRCVGSEFSPGAGQCGWLGPFLRLGAWRGLFSWGARVVRRCGTVCWGQALVAARSWWWPLVIGSCCLLFGA